MAKIDEGAKETEDVLKDLEERIAKEYAQAEKEVQEKLEKYLESFQKKDEAKKAQLAAGEITQQEYNQWRVGQVAIGKRWEEMRDTIAQDYTNTAQIAKSTAFGTMPEVYALNHNYGTFQVEKESRVDTSYTMYNKYSVERMFKDEKFYPSPGKKVTAEIDAGRQKAWDVKRVQSVMVQALLQGESMPKIAKRLAKTVGESDKKAAIRNARTMTTCVQNAGRLDSYKRAEGMGIEIQNEWIAALDDRTRHEHRLLDGQKVNIGEKFKVEGDEIEYPGDPSAPGYLVYNCRCSLAPFIKGISKDSDYYNDLSDRETSKLGDMTYEEWKNAHNKSADESDTGTTGKTGTSAGGDAGTSSGNEAPTIEKMYDGTGVNEEQAKEAFVNWADGEAYDIRFAQQNGYKNDSADYMEELIEESNIHYEGDLYRGIMGDQETANFYYDMLDKIENGEEIDFTLIDMMGTSSWSADQNVAETFSRRANEIGGLDMTEGDYTPIVFKTNFRKNKLAINIDRYAGLNQKEVVVSKNAQFYIEHLEVTDAGTIEVNLGLWEE